ncbi:uncharacterized protein HD556DRAFT_1538018 [Suillus plorans]|uniref:Uncharacterized protein n=1 Tax=Suillus plorans TaxID=116603 RepID=A0A9P7DET0_9AGAM|nr:uncharacterized protein HD556DRAFT_1538018 [Suillus plorans]KAG1790005.1 hypothetical protein HD556DRAFT_1538018 [Suillus plorans]
MAVAHAKFRNALSSFGVWSPSCLIAQPRYPERLLHLSLCVRMRHFRSFDRPLGKESGPANAVLLDNGKMSIWLFLSVESRWNPVQDYRIMLRPCIERSEVLIHMMSYTGAAGIDNSRLKKSMTQ